MKRSLGCLAAAFMLLAPASLSAAIDEAELRERMAAKFDATVLSIDEGQINGDDVWLVKMMRGRDAGNAAFKVDMVAVDPETGEPLRGRVPDLNPAHFLNSISTPMGDRRPDAFPRVRMEGR